MLANNYNPVAQIADGTNKEWTYDFDVRSAEDLELYVVDDNTVSKVSDNITVNGDTQTITYPTEGAALAAGKKVWILRNTPLGQTELNHANPDNYSYKAIERSEDITNMRIQESAWWLERGVKVPLNLNITPQELINYFFTETEVAIEELEAIKQQTLAAMQAAETAAAQAIALLAIIITSGAGDKFLTDDGTYKSVSREGDNYYDTYISTDNAPLMSLILSPVEISDSRYQKAQTGWINKTANNTAAWNLLLTKYSAADTATETIDTGEPINPASPAQTKKITVPFLDGLGGYRFITKSVWDNILQETGACPYFCIEPANNRFLLPLNLRGFRGAALESELGYLYDTTKPIIARAGGINNWYRDRWGAIPAAAGETDARPNPFYYGPAYQYSNDGIRASGNDGNSGQHFDSGRLGAKYNGAETRGRSLGYYQYYKMTLPTEYAPQAEALKQYPNLAAFPPVGDGNTVYVARDVNKAYFWITAENRYQEIAGSSGTVQTARARGSVINAYQSQGDVYSVDTFEITDGGSGYQAGDALILAYKTGETDGLILNAILIVSGTDGGGNITSLEISKAGAWNADKSGAFPAINAGQSGGTGANITVEMSQTAASTLFDIENPAINDTARVIHSELSPSASGGLQGQDFQYADFNGDGIANWVPISNPTSETDTPILANE
jgi:hypothetical protein